MLFWPFLMFLKADTGLPDPKLVENLYYSLHIQMFSDCLWTC